MSKLRIAPPAAPAETSTTDRRPDILDWGLTEETDTLRLARAAFAGTVLARLVVAALRLGQDAYGPDEDVAEDLVQHIAAFNSRLCSTLVDRLTEKAGT